MSSPPSPSLGFDKAHYTGDPAPADACAFCGRGLTQEYFRIADRLACSVCARNAEALAPRDSAKAYTRALLFGAGAALAGCAGYALFGILTGIALGWAAIGVGWLVGKMMRRGSGGLGGRRYQITAALLTYAAVAVAFVPMALHERSRTEKGRGSAQTSGQRMESREATKAQNDAARETGDSPNSGERVNSRSEARSGLGPLFLAMLMLLGIGLISPFLAFTGSFASGLLNLFILFLGMRTAWQLSGTGPVLVDGPFRTAARTEGQT